MNWLRHIGSYLWGYTLARYASEQNGTLEVSYINGKLVLDSAEANYSYGRLHQVFRKALKASGIKPQGVLVLGFGAGSVATILAEEMALDCDITGIEHDPVIIEIFHTWFHPERFGRLTLLAADAVAFTRQASQRFNMVVADLFRDQEVPAAATTEEFVTALQRLVLPGGCLLFNYIVTDSRQEDAAMRLRSLLSRSGTLAEHRYYGINRVFIWKP